MLDDPGQVFLELGQRDVLMVRGQRDARIVGPEQNELAVVSQL